VIEEGDARDPTDGSTHYDVEGPREKPKRGGATHKGQETD
jgi:hypothetical protein